MNKSTITSILKEKFCFASLGLQWSLSRTLGAADVDAFSRVKLFLMLLRAKVLDYKAFSCISHHSASNGTKETSVFSFISVMELFPTIINSDSNTVRIWIMIPTLPLEGSKTPKLKLSGNKTRQNERSFAAQRECKQSFTNFFRTSLCWIKFGLLVISLIRAIIKRTLLV